jgi:hypothetical protein
VPEHWNIEEQHNEDVESRRALLEQRIESNEHLKALTQIIGSAHYPDEELHRAINAWNHNTQQWVGGAVEKRFPGAHGRVLVVMMDYQDNIRLGVNV